jgi:pilus assembly protein CpaF
MLCVTIRQTKDKQQAPRQLNFQKDEIVVGRLQTNDIVLPKGNISKTHAKFERRGNALTVTDLQSTNKTFVNGHAIPHSKPHKLKPEDKIFMGDFVLEVKEQATPAPQIGTPPAAFEQQRRAAVPPARPPVPAPQHPQGRAGMPSPPPIPQPAKPQEAAPAPRPLPPIRQEQANPAHAYNWNQVAMQQGPSYSYVAIPQGWLLLTPSGQLTVLPDPQHQQPPRPLR